MKKDIKYYLLATALFGVLQISAAGKENPVNDGNAKSKAVRLSASVLRSFSKIAIADQTGVVLHSESLDGSKETGMQIDFSNLPVGNYFLEMDSAVKLVIVPLAVNENEAILKTAAKTEIYKPFARTSGTSLQVMGFNPEKTPIMVSIYDENNELMFEETLVDLIELKRSYNFSKAGAGSYSIQIKKDGKVFWFNYNG